MTTELREIVVIYYPTERHYTHAVFADSVRWAGLRDGEVTNDLLEMLSIGMVKLTRVGSEEDADSTLLTLAGVLNSLGALEQLQKLRQPQGLSTDEGVL